MSVSIEDVEIVETRIGANCRFLVSEMMGHCHAKELDFVCTAELVLKSIKAELPSAKSSQHC